MGTLLITAGGGGDAIAAVLVAPLLGIAGPPTVLSWSWDRLIIDPLPGPRSAADFVGLRTHAPGLHEVLPGSTLRSPAGSSLPRLAAELPARLLLLEATAGVVGMAAQITAAAQFVDADDLVLVDVGGDVLARGGEPNLRSPLADLMTLAACATSGVPCRLAIAGPGVDGEIGRQEVLDRLRGVGAERLPVLSSATASATSRVFAWHPSEASGVFAAAACGFRGRVELRDAGDQVTLDDSTASVYVADAAAAYTLSPAVELARSRTLDEASTTLRALTGVCELDYERAKATRNGSAGPTPSTGRDLEAIDAAAQAAARRGSDFLTVRRLAELVGVRTAGELAELRAGLAVNRADHDCSPLPLYRTRSAR